MPTTTDLRDMLHERADTTSSAPPPVVAAIRGGRRVRIQRRIVAGAGAVAVVAAVAVPTVVGWPITDRPSREQTQLPGDDGADLPSTGGWVDDVPGLDLPVGPALDTPYADGRELHVGDSILTWDSQILQILMAPEGLVVASLVGDGPASSGTSQTRLELINTDGEAGERIELARGFLSRPRMGLAANGGTRLAWTSWGTADGGSVQAHSALLSDPSNLSTVGSGLDLQIVGVSAGDVILTRSLVEAVGTDEEPALMLRWTPGTETLAPILADPGDGSFVLQVGVGPDEDLALVFSGGQPQCTYATSMRDPGARVWQDCEGGPLTASSDGSLGANQLGTVDLATGERVVTFDLGMPDLPPWNEFNGVTSVEVVGWSGDDVLLVVSYAGPAQTTAAADDGDPNDTGWSFNPAVVGIRCSSTTGACTRVPHPIETVAVEHR